MTYNRNGESTFIVKAQSIDESLVAFKLLQKLSIYIFHF